MANENGVTLEHFSVEDFVTTGIQRDEEIELLASVKEDGDHYILRITPHDTSPVFKVPKTAVRLGAKHAPLDEFVGDKGQTFALTINRSAPCLLLHASTVEKALEDARKLVRRNAKITTLNAQVAFANSGEGTLSFGGTTFACLGRPGFKYTNDLTVKGEVDKDKFRRKYSNEFQVWMDFAILIMGQKGIYIHEGPDNLEDNGGPSAGCIHLAPGNAEEFYNWVSGRTRIQISYPW